MCVIGKIKEIIDVPASQAKIGLRMFATAREATRFNEDGTTDTRLVLRAINQVYTFQSRIVRTKQPTVGCVMRKVAGGEGGYHYKYVGKSIGRVTGFWAFTPNKTCLPYYSHSAVYAVVKLYGKVAHHDTGYRAEKMKIVALFSRNNDLEKDLKWYGIPTYSFNSEREAENAARKLAQAVAF